MPQTIEIAVDRFGFPCLSGRIGVVRRGRRGWGFRRRSGGRWFLLLCVWRGWRCGGLFRGVGLGEGRMLFEGSQGAWGRVGRCRMLGLWGGRCGAILVQTVPSQLPLESSCIGRTGFLGFEIIVFIHDILAGITHPNLLLQAESRSRDMRGAFIIENPSTNPTMMFPSESYRQSSHPRRHTGKLFATLKTLVTTLILHPKLASQIPTLESSDNRFHGRPSRMC